MIILFAFIIDIILGDPHCMFHPVRWIGKMIMCLEVMLRRTSLPLKISGILLTVIIVAITYSISYLAISSAYRINHYFGFISSVIILYTTFSVRSLYDESMKVYEALKENNLTAAQKDLSMIVGRDTERLVNGEIIRATVETVAENTVDGVIAPLFYAFLGGPPLAIAYKAVNTLDSMVGYKDDKYIKFGWASAKLDDLASYIPARLSGFVIPIASLLCGKDWWNSFAIVLSDHKNHPSPNSGIPEAAVAGALGIQLGGLNYYGGIPSPKPFIGQFKNDLTMGHIAEVNMIMIVSSVLMVLSGITVVLIVSSIH